jgi:hypothetical protein
VVHCVALTDFCRLLPADAAAGAPPRNKLAAALDAWEALLSTKGAGGEKAFALGEREWGEHRAAREWARWERQREKGDAKPPAGAGPRAAPKLAVHVHLLLTKVDLFEALLLRGVPLRAEPTPAGDPPRFLDFRGGANVADAIGYIKGRFEKLADKHRVPAQVDTVNLLDPRGALVAKVQSVVEGAFFAKTDRLDMEESADKGEAPDE